jgi:hypothetical protein
MKQLQCILICQGQPQEVSIVVNYTTHILRQKSVDYPCHSNGAKDQHELGRIRHDLSKVIFLIEPEGSFENSWEASSLPHL